MFEVGVPPASVFRGETIGDERVLTLISLWGQRMKVHLASTSFFQSLDLHQGSQGP
jgi:hypothetical protein